MRCTLNSNLLTDLITFVKELDDPADAKLTAYNKSAQTDAIYYQHFWYYIFILQFPFLFLLKKNTLMYSMH